MRKFDITKNETCFYQETKKQAIGKGKRWPMLLFLFIVVAGGAYAQAPTLSYSSPQVYQPGVAISPLAPTGSGVAAFGYNAPVVMGAGQLSHPYGVALDAAGNVYITDNGNSQVIKVPAGGRPPIIVATGFNSPTGIVRDAAGDLFVAESGSNDLKKIPAGGGPPVVVATGLNNPKGLAIDNAGNIYIADAGSNRVLRRPHDGGPLAVLGSGFSAPSSVAVNGSGDVYVADNSYNITKLSPGGSESIVLTNPASQKYSAIGIDSDGNIYVSATYDLVKYSSNFTHPFVITATNIRPQIRIYNPTGIAIDAAGNVFVADYKNTVVKYLAGTTKGQVVDAGFYDLGPMATDTAGNLYVVDIINLLIKKFPADGGPPVIVRSNLVYPQLAATDRAGNLYIGIDLEHKIYKFPNDGSPATTITSSGFNYARGLAIDSKNNIICLNENGTVVKVPPGGGDSYINVVNVGENVSLGQNVSLIAIDASDNIYMNGPDGKSVEEFHPNDRTPVILATGFGNIIGLAVDAPGNVYITQGPPAYSVVKIPVGGGTPQTISSDFGYPGYIALDTRGNMYVQDMSRNFLNPTVDKLRPKGGYFISPALPAGLNFDDSTGIISGTPTKVSPDATYTITAYNSSGGTSARVNISVLKKNLNLTNIALSAGSLSPAFNSDSVNYTVAEGPDQGGIFVTPTAADPAAWIKVNGRGGVSSGSAVFVPLSMGANSISIVITGGDGASKTYTINAVRGPYNANLSQLHPNAGHLNQNFMPAVTSYTDSVDYAHTSVSITPVAVDPLATIQINGITVASGSASPAIPLDEGPNTITTVVTAGNGITTKSYTINVFRDYSNNANLSEMHPSAGHLDQYFTPVVTSYTDAVNYTNTWINITPVAQDPLATIEVNGAVVASGSLSQAIALPVGNTVINTVVTAPDGFTTKTFTLTVTRAAGPINIPDESLSVDQQPVLPTIADDGVAVHRAISPNGDGINDFLVIDGIAKYPENKLVIMNNSGQLIFEAKDYDNSSKVFDGHSSKTGQMQLPGTYFYSLEYTVKGVIKRKTGYLVLKY